jgi:putative transposase
MARYNNISKIDNQYFQMQELKAAIKNNRDKSMHVRYMVIYHYLEGAANVDIANMFNICAHTVGNYIKKYTTNGLSSLVPAPKSGAPKLLSKEQEERLKEIITLNTPDNVGFPNKKNWTTSLALQWVNNNFHIEYSHSGMLKVLHRLGLSFTKPTYTLAKADSKKQEEFKASFEVLKKPS